MATIYQYTHQPRYWVVHDDDGYWLVPARTDGWSERSPFVGHVVALRQITDLDGIDLGLPDQRQTPPDDA
jgi:glucose-6-phosphate 1-epimerase